MENNIYDVIILGGGPAGLSAAIYAARALLKVAVIENSIVGGQIILTNEIVNYPGCNKDESGFSLIQRFQESAVSFGAEIINDTIEKVDFEGDIKRIFCSKDELLSKTIIIATGASPRKLLIPGEQEFIGRGVSYCATCDGAFFKDKSVFVVGGGDSAVEEAVYLTKFAKNVTIIHRRDELRASRIIQEHAKNHEKIRFLLNTIVVEIKGEKFLTELLVRNVVTGEENIVKADSEGENVGLFVFIGNEPNNSLFEGVFEGDETGFIITDEEMRLKTPGVFAAGDIRKKSLRQVVTATADGAIAAVAAAKYIESKDLGQSQKQ